MLHIILHGVKLFNMDAKEIIEAAGGAKKVMKLTGLSRAGVSNWRTQNYIPQHWIKFLRLKFPAIRKATLDLAPTYYTKAKKQAAQSVQILSKD